MQTPRQLLPTREDWAKLIISFKPTHFVTLCPNPFHAKQAGRLHIVSEAQAAKHIAVLFAKLDARMNSRLFGRRYYELPSSRRMESIVAIEHCASNTHAHVFIKKLPANARVWPDLEIMLTQEWRNIVPGGTVDVRDMPSADALANRAFYVTKEHAWHIDEKASDRILIFPEIPR